MNRISKSYVTTISVDPDSFQSRVDAYALDKIRQAVKTINALNREQYKNSINKCRDRGAEIIPQPEKFKVQLGYRLGEDNSYANIYRKKGNYQNIKKEHAKTADVYISRKIYE